MKKFKLGQLYTDDEKVIKIVAIENNFCFYDVVIPENVNIRGRFNAFGDYAEKLNPYKQKPEQIEVGDFVKINVDIPLKDFDVPTLCLVNRNGFFIKYQVTKVEGEFIYLSTCDFGNRVYHKKYFEIVQKRLIEILDKEEKKYLKAFIRPYGRNIKITKRKMSDSEYLEFEIIRHKNLTKYSSKTDFPPFAEKTMYKGMELDKKYTLEELGL